MRCRVRRGQSMLLELAYFLIASTSLAYHTPHNWILVVQALPLAGALVLLGVQLQQASAPYSLMKDARVE
jgi:hypothetical protein